MITADVQRSVYGRIEELPSGSIPPPYRVHRPLIEGVTTGPVMTNAKAGKSCMNWIACCSGEEFINTRTGKTLDNRNSRLCKRSMFAQYLQLCIKFDNGKNASLFANSYQTFKDAATLYQKIRETLFEFLEKSGRGKWVQKPKELNCFFLDDDDDDTLEELWPQ